jgi:hypothetical protein
MPPDASASPPRQLPLPCALPPALPPPRVPRWTRPEQVWASLPPEVRRQIRQTWLRVLREVIANGGER